MSISSRLMNYSRFFLGCKEKFFRKIVKKVDKWVCLLYNISEFCGGRPAEEGYICRTTRYKEEDDHEKAKDF